MMKAIEKVKENTGINVIKVNAKRRMENIKFEPYSAVSQNGSHLHEKSTFSIQKVSE